MENPSNASPFESFARKVDEQWSGVAPKVEEAVARVVAYLNDEVVPQVRRNSSGALRAASEHLTKLADYLEHLPGDGAQGGKS